MVQKIKKQPLAFMLGLILLVQFILIAVCNLSLIDKHLDCDNAKLFVHIMHMWEEKTIFIPDWSHVNTFELDCASLIALPLYALTGNIYLAFGIANVIFVAIYIGLIFYMFSGENPTRPLLVANLICIPYAYGMLDYFNMMFFCGSQYVLKVMIPIMLIALLLRIERKDVQNKKAKALTLYVVIYLLLVFVTSLSSGIYVAMVGLLPIFAVYVIYKLQRYEKIPKVYYLVAITSVVAVLIGLILNNVIMDGAVGNRMTLCSIYDILNNVTSCFFGIFELFGGAAYSADVSVLSLKGISIILKIGFTLVVLVCAFIGLMKVIKKKSDLRSVLLLAVFGWNMFVLCITNTSYGASTYEYRYHLVGMIPLLFIAGELLVEFLEYHKGVTCLIFSTIGVGAVLMLNVVSFKEVYTAEDSYADLKELTAYVEELDVEYAYLYNESSEAEICRLLSQDDTTWLYVTPGGLTLVYDYYEKYVEMPVVADNAVLIVNNSIADFGDTFEFGGYMLKRFSTKGNPGRSLYYFVD